MARPSVQCIGGTQILRPSRSHSTQRQVGSKDRAVYVGMWFSSHQKYSPACATDTSATDRPFKATARPGAPACSSRGPMGSLPSGLIIQPHQCVICAHSAYTGAHSRLRLVRQHRHHIATLPSCSRRNRGSSRLYQPHFDATTGSEGNSRVTHPPRRAS